MTQTIQIDLTDLDAFMAGEHHAMFEWLRRNDPVYWQSASDGPGFWALTRYQDIVTAYNRHDVFSSTSGTILGGSFHDDLDTAAGGMLVSSDLPQHRQLKEVLHRAFAPSVLQRVNQCVTDLVDVAVDRAIADGGCDFAMDVARELPTGALMGIMDLSHDESYHLIKLTHDMIDFRNPAYVSTEEEARLRLADIQSQIFGFFTGLMARPRGQDSDDLVGLLLRGQVNGRDMQLAELLYNCLNVAVGGNTTSVYGSCAGTIAFIENPGQYELLLADGGLVGPAVEEILRWTTPNAYDQRVARKDFELGGKQIRAGDSVALWIVSANRDEEVFPEADRFRVTRTPNHHLAFGTGVHRCIGMRFAQAELRILLDKLRARRVRFEIAGQLDPIRTNFMQGFRHLPLRVVDAC